jgi:predicted nucleic acid-binding protein
MYLVDTSVWANHIARPDPKFRLLLNENKVLGHAFVLGELLLGNLKNRKAFRSDYESLTQADLSENGEVLRMMEEHRLPGTGIGYVDAHILASAMLMRCKLLTRDKRLVLAATKVGVEVPA